MMRYPGGKWRLAGWIIANIPSHRIYVEPYGGGASVLLQKQRAYAEIYNDLNGEVCNLFRQARDNGEELLEKLRLTPFARDEFEQSMNPSGDPLEDARRVVVRSYMGFGSNSLYDAHAGFRSNSNRSGTTPAHDWKNLPDGLNYIIKRLQGVVIENRDAITCMSCHDSPDTVHYVDPPYMLETRGKSSLYGDFELTDSQHLELLEFLQTLEGTVVLSGYQCKLYEENLKGWNLRTKRAMADGAREREECLWISKNENQPNLGF